VRLELSRFVESDLNAIAAFIAEDNPRRALSFLGEIQEKILRIGEQPLLYQLRPEIGEAARIAVVGNYLILFRRLRRCCPYRADYLWQPRPSV